MFDFRNLYVDTFAAYNGGSKERYWSVGFYTAEGAEQCDETWQEIDSLPGSTPFAEVDSYVNSLNAPASLEPAAEERQEQAQEQQEQAPTASLADQAQEVFGSCNWLAGLPVPMFFELRAMAQELKSGQAVTFESGFWYDGWSKTHQAKVRVGDQAQVWLLGSNSGRWYA